MQRSLRRRIATGTGVLALLLASVLGGHQGEAAEPRTRVILNGVPTPVFFNDGDSFRVLGGEYTGAKARLAGFNTLESYGPVHQWGTWTAKELYVIAKMATLNGRRGVWTCESDGSTDTYGRMLVWCPDLAEDQVRKGLAHVMSINDDPGKPQLVAAQQEAIEARRGIWAHGVPTYVLTSLHSAEEDLDGKGTYNRLVASSDGHSAKWKHSNKYKECHKACHMVYTVDEAAVDQVLSALATDTAPAVTEAIEGLDATTLRATVREFAEYRVIDRSVPKPKRQALKEHLIANYVDKGMFGVQQASEGACMTHVDFNRRFGGAKASCLK